MTRTLSKTAAVSLHSAFSLAIFVALLYLIIFHWYPRPYFTLDGGWQGIRIAFLVDIVLGPLLTLIVYKPHKRHLKLDMTIIAMVQITALIWGVTTIYQQRTALVVFVDDALHTVNPEQVSQAGIDLARFTSTNSMRPPMAFLRLPEHRAERRAFIRESEFKRGTPVIRLGDRYELMTPERMERMFETAAVDPLAVATDRERAEQVLDGFLQDHGGNAADYAFIPLVCRYGNGVLAIRRADQAILAVPDFPFPVIY